MLFRTHLEFLDLEVAGAVQELLSCSAQSTTQNITLKQWGKRAPDIAALASLSRRMSIYGSMYVI